MCVFCEIIKGKLPAHIIYENNQLISFLDIEPINEGHVLIVPKQHVDTIEELSDETLTDIMDVAKKIVVALKESYGNEGYSIMQNGGKFCDFGHVHFHVFPRYDNDGFGWTYGSGERKVNEKIAERIRQQILQEVDSVIGRIVTVTVDRPLGSYHPEYKDMYYPINYGYVEGRFAPDGEEQDAYILGVNQAVEKFTGKIIAIVHRNNDVEEKWIVAPDEMSFTEKEIREKIHFQEQYFDSEIVM